MTIYADEPVAAGDGTRTVLLYADTDRNQQIAQVAFSVDDMEVARRTAREKKVGLNTVLKMIAAERVGETAPQLLAPTPVKPTTAVADTTPASALEPSLNVPQHTHEFDVPEHEHEDTSTAITTLKDALQGLLVAIQSLEIRQPHYASKEHGHAHLEDGIAGVGAQATRVSLEVSKVAEQLATHEHLAYVHDHAAYATNGNLTTVIDAVNALGERVNELYARPVVAEHHHTECATQDALTPILSRLAALEARQPETVEVPHVHVYDTKGTHRGEWLCVCGEKKPGGSA